MAPLLLGALGGGNYADPPINVSATQASSSSITVTWAHGLQTTSGKGTPLSYVVTSYNSSGTAISTVAGSIAYPAASTTITGLSASTTYKFSVRLINSVATSAESVQASATTASSGGGTPPPPPPPPPAGPDCTTCVDGQSAPYEDFDSSCTSGKRYYITCYTDSTQGCSYYPIAQGCVPTGSTTTDCTTCVFGTYSDTIADSSCASGTRNVTVCATDVGCPNTQTLGSCTTPTCTAGCGSYGSYDATCGACTTSRSRTRTCTRTDCTTYTQTQTVACSCTPSTTYSPVNYGACSGGWKWRNVYWVNSDCSCGSYSQKKAC